MILTPVESFFLIIGVYLAMTFAVFEYKRRKHIAYWKARAKVEMGGE